MTSPTKFLNEDTLLDLINSIGSGPTCGVLKVFLGEISVLATDINSHLNAEAFDLIATLAHTLKSTSATFGADRLNAVAAQMERAANAKDHDVLTALLKDLKFCIGETTPLYRKYTE